MKTLPFRLIPGSSVHACLSLRRCPKRIVSLPAQTRLPDADAKTLTYPAFFCCVPPTLVYDIPESSIKVSQSIRQAAANQPYPGLHFHGGDHYRLELRSSALTVTLLSHLSFSVPSSSSSLSLHRPPFTPKCVYSTVFFWSPLRSLDLFLDRWYPFQPVHFLEIADRKSVV